MSWVSTVKGCPLSGVPLYLILYNIAMSLYSIIDTVSCLLCRLKASFDRCATMREPNVEPGASIGGSSEEEGEGEEQDSSESPFLIHSSSKF